MRWSGEAGWIPFGDLDLGLGPENATSYPHPGEIVLYPGGVSETEILLAYGYVNFASKAGQLAGNHFATIVEGNENLRELGKKFLWEGAQEIVFRESSARGPHAPGEEQPVERVRENVDRERHVFRRGGLVGRMADATVQSAHEEHHRAERRRARARRHRDRRRRRARQAVARARRSRRGAQPSDTAANSVGGTAREPSIPSAATSRSSRSDRVPGIDR